VTIEEAALAGGFGSACLEALERADLLGSVRVRRLGFPDAFITHGDPKAQRAELGLDAGGLVAAARALLRASARTQRGAA
jgi:1-deoxy-D-xylulose-5-phosphate synthase